MDSDAELDAAWRDYTSSTSSLAMLGWQDSDHDGIFDVLDVPLSLTGTGYFDPHEEEYRFAGQSAVQTLVNLNPNGRRNDISVNEVSRLVYSLNGGVNWEVADTFQSAEVTFDVSIPITPGDEIVLRTESLDPITGQLIAVSDQTFRGSAQRPSMVTDSGLHGFVWHDQNGNGEWESDERGVAGLTLQLVDEAGVPVETAQHLDPDQHTSTALLNDVLAGVTLSAVGTGVADARVAAIDVAGISGEQRLFGFVRGGTTGSWTTQWNSDTRLLRIDFDTPTTYLSIDTLAPWNDSQGRLEIYDSEGKLLGRQTSKVLEAGERATLAIGTATPDIAYALVRGTYESAIQLTNLQVGPDSETVSGAFGAYALPHLPQGNYRVAASSSDIWAVGGSDSSVLDLAVLADGRMQWATDSPRPSDFAVLPLPEASGRRNHDFASDVNDDWILSPIDALLVIHDLNTNGSRHLSAEEESAGGPFIDVTGDKRISPIDALSVISALNFGTTNGQPAPDVQEVVAITAWSADFLTPTSGEGEQVTGPEGEADTLELIEASEVAEPFAMALNQVSIGHWIESVKETPPLEHLAESTLHVRDVRRPVTTDPWVQWSGMDGRGNLSARTATETSAGESIAADLQDLSTHALRSSDGGQDLESLLMLLADDICRARTA